MVGDREHDVIGAHLAGLDVIGVLYGYGSREELTAAGADQIAETPEALETTNSVNKLTFRQEKR